MRATRIGTVSLAAESNSPAGSWEEDFADMTIVNTDGTVEPIYSGGTTASGSPWGSSGYSQGALAVWNAPANGGDTHYSHGDQIGSTRTVTTVDGWPLSSDTFYPYGQEPAGTASPTRFQYAGLERDPETGLDHATFRQYSSTMGRWMSPDPYDGSMDLGNPQSLNRYSYVGNNPLGITDPSGLDGDQPGPPDNGPGFCWSCIYNWVFPSAPSFNGSITRRADGSAANRQIWDEYHIHYGADIAGALGLPSQGCEFGACGGGGYGFAQGNSPTVDQSKAFL